MRRIEYEELDRSSTPQGILITEDGRFCFNKMFTASEGTLDSILVAKEYRNSKFIILLFICNQIKVIKITNE